MFAHGAPSRDVGIMEGEELQSDRETAMLSILQRSIDSLEAMKRRICNGQDLKEVSLDGQRIGTYLYSAFLKNDATSQSNKECSFDSIPGDVLVYAFSHYLQPPDLTSVALTCRSLRLRQIPALKALFSVSLPLTRACRSLEACSSVRGLGERCPNLKAISINFNHMQSSCLDTFAAMAMSTPNVENLELHNAKFRSDLEVSFLIRLTKCWKIKRLKMVSTHNRATRKIVDECSHLQELEVSQGKFGNNVFTAVSRCSTLRSFHISKWILRNRRTHAENNMRLLRNCRLLSKLHIQNTIAGDIQVEWFYETCMHIGPMLVDIKFHYDMAGKMSISTSEASLDSINMLCRNCPNIERFHVDAALTDAQVEAIARRLRRLKFVHLGKVSANGIHLLLGSPSINNVVIGRQVVYVSPSEVNDTFHRAHRRMLGTEHRREFDRASAAAAAHHRAHAAAPNSSSSSPTVVAGSRGYLVAAPNSFSAGSASSASASDAMMMMVDEPSERAVDHANARVVRKGPATQPKGRPVKRTARDARLDKSPSKNRHHRSHSLVVPGANPEFASSSPSSSLSVTTPSSPLALSSRLLSKITSTIGGTLSSLSSYSASSPEMLHDGTLGHSPLSSPSGDDAVMTPADDADADRGGAAGAEIPSAFSASSLGEHISRQISNTSSNSSSAGAGRAETPTASPRVTFMNSPSVAPSSFSQSSMGTLVDQGLSEDAVRRHTQWMEHEKYDSPAPELALGGGSSSSALTPKFATFFDDAKFGRSDGGVWMDDARQHMCVVDISASSADDEALFKGLIKRHRYCFEACPRRSDGMRVRILFGHSKPDIRLSSAFLSMSRYA